LLPSPARSRFVPDLSLAGHLSPTSRAACRLRRRAGQKVVRRGLWPPSDLRQPYVKYLGWFDGNPANLHNLPPEETAKHYVEFMGGADEVLAKAHAAFEKGEYRWVAEVVNHVVFADPSNQRARALQADTLEQMGYQAEAGTWRGLYLTAAKELRDGVASLPVAGSASPDSIKAMSLALLFNVLGVRLNGPNAAGRSLTLNLVFTDTGENAVLELRNGSLNHRWIAWTRTPT
jgi:alkyl sulfatase BDS1-like metallo-beta-lactamase superfamily hydrolase